MYLNLSVILTFTTIINQSLATYWTNLSFNKGDIVFCKINVFADHVLLATSSSTVAHMMGSKDTSKGKIIEEPWSKYHTREGNGQTDCWIKTSNTMANAVERARKDIAHYNGQNIYYDLYKCNCEHWVRYWAQGAVVSEQVKPLYNGEASWECDVGRAYGNRHEVIVKQHSDGNFYGSGTWDRFTYSDDECLEFPRGTQWRNSITQIQLTGYCVRIWSHSDCSGNTWCVCEDVKDLSYHKRNRDDNWNDDIVSISGCAYRSPIVAIAEVYQKDDYEGRMRKIVLQSGECYSLYQSDWWNDAVSSIKVTLGCVRFYDHSRCTGPSYTETGNRASLSSGWDNEATSFAPC